MLLLLFAHDFSSLSSTWKKCLAATSARRIKKTEMDEIHGESTLRQVWAQKNNEKSEDEKSFLFYFSLSRHFN